MTKNDLIQGFLRIHRWEVFCVILSGTLVSLLSVIIPLSIGGFFELAFHEGGSKSQLLQMLGMRFETIREFFIAFFTLVVLRGLFGYVEFYLASTSKEKLSAYLREELFRAQLLHTPESFYSRSVTKYLVKYGNDLSAIQNYFVKGRWKWLADIAFFVCAFALLISMSLVAGLIVMSSFGVAAGVLFLLNPVQKRHTETKKSARSALMNFVELRLNAFNTLKIFNRQVPELKQFQKLNDRVLTTSKNDQVLAALIQGLLPVFFFSVLGLVLMYISTGIPEMGASSAMIVFVLLMLYMQSAFKRVLRLPTIWLQGKSSLQSLIELLNLKAESQPEDGLKLSFKKKTIELEEVSFSYDQGPMVLQRFSASFPPVNTTLVEGKGKSTLMKLLLCLEKPNHGKLRISDHDYNAIPPKTIRKQIAYVGAEAPLLGSTVFNAISYSRDAENRPGAEEMLKRVQLHIDVAPSDLLDFKLDREASNISASERKKLQFARALLTEKKILLLDEPFADIDNHTKTILVNLLNSLRGQLTIVIAANNVPEGLIIDKIIKL